MAIPMSDSLSELKRIRKRLDDIEETMEILADKRTLSCIKKSLEDIKAGRYKDYRNVKQSRKEFDSKA